MSRAILAEEISRSSPLGAFASPYISTLPSAACLYLGVLECSQLILTDSSLTLIL